MRGRVNIIAVAIILAILSFVYARYDYVNKNSATLTNPFGSHESTTIASPIMKSLFDVDWMKHEMTFAIVVPIAFIAVGCGIALGKK